MGCYKILWFSGCLLQEHEKVLRSKRQEQEKWEEQVLKRGRGLFATASTAVDEPPSLH